jgi:hypothetical protein
MYHLGAPVVSRIIQMFQNKEEEEEESAETVLRATFAPRVWEHKGGHC